MAECVGSRQSQAEIELLCHGCTDRVGVALVGVVQIVDGGVLRFQRRIVKNGRIAVVGGGGRYGIKPFARILRHKVIDANVVVGL